MQNLPLKTLAVLGSVGAGLAGGLFLTSGIAAPAAPNTPADDTFSVSTPEYSTNAAGETYGSAYLADRDEDEPDLIGAIATNGKEGYVKKSDLSPTPPSSPAEAVALTKQYAANARSGAAAKVIPVYTKDGIAVIGEFELSYDADAETRETPESTQVEK